MITVSRPDLGDLAIGLSRGVIYRVTIALVDGSTTIVTASTYHAATGDMAWAALDISGDVVFHGEDAFKLADWICDTAWCGVTEAGELTYDPKSGAEVVSVKVDLDMTPLLDERAEDREWQRVLDFERLVLPMYDIVLGFGSSIGRRA